MDKNSKIYIAGHRGMVGSAILRRMSDDGYTKFILKSSSELDLVDQTAVKAFFNNEKPDIIIDAAAKVGGILANNTYRAQFIYENLMIQNNLIHAAHENKIEKFLFLGSSCIYPKLSPQPMKEEYLLSGELEPTNEPYAIAKIAGIKMCENYFKQYGDNFLSIMPTNLYGENDNFDLKTSHVLPALINKFHEAKLKSKASVEIWGTGAPKREFLHVDDLASAAIFVLENIDADELYDKLRISHLNIGTGKDISIKELSLLIKEVIGFDGDLEFDKSKPDGTPQKLLDVSAINNKGWKFSIDLKDGIESTYQWYLQNI
jgi:GDP-L-fucose synthase|tara:strand:+ start:148 stop:1098 length:951 start_codon:yes stop_codon:yes gene_type:complete